MPRLLTLVVVVFAGLVQAAGAGGATVRGDDVLGVLYEAAPGEINNVRVSYSAGSYTIRDTGATLTPGNASCVTVDPNEVRCTNSGMFTWRHVDLRLGDGDDRATIVSVSRTDVAQANVRGEAGNDVATFEDASGSMYGGDGNDRLELAQFTATAFFFGENGDDFFRGGNYLDDFNGGDGDDTVVYSGYDRLTGGSGSDTLDFSAVGQAQRFDLAAGTITLSDIDTTFENVKSGSGDDVLIGGPPANRLEGGGGDDLLDGAFGPDTIIGGNGFDVADYSARTDGVTIVIYPAITSGNGDDAGPAGPGDSIHEDVEGAFGGDGDDVFVGSAAGNLFNGGHGADEYTGFGGFDLVDYSDRTADVTVILDGSESSGNDDDGPEGARDLVRADVEDIAGGDGDDTLVGNGADNFLDGGFGADILRGGPGNDLADYSWRNADLTIMLDGTPRSGNDDDGPAGARDVLESIEDAVGGYQNDTIFGNAADNILISGLGDDTLDGGAGRDELDAGADSDRITSRDGEVDSLFCGEHWDTVTVDRIDVLVDCDVIDQGPAAAATTAARDITESSATLTGVVHPNRAPTGVWFELGTTTAYGTRSPTVTLPGGNDDVPVTAQVKGLIVGTLYHFRVVAQNNPAGPTYGADTTFTTAKADVVVTPPASVRCRVPNVKGKSLAAGKRALLRANCGVGKVRRIYSRTVRKGRILSQSRRPGASLPRGAKVGVAVSRGKKPQTRPRRR